VNFRVIPDSDIANIALVHVKVHVRLVRSAINEGRVPMDRRLSGILKIVPSNVAVMCAVQAFGRHGGRFGAESTVFCAAAQFVWVDAIVACRVPAWSGCFDGGFAMSVGL
jgi:hypothetical protein